MARAPAISSSGWKTNLIVPANGVFILRQDLGRHQQNGHVCVVATGMHYARVLGLVFNIIFFVERQGVHIRPQHQNGTGAGSFQECNHPGFGHALGGQTQVLKVGLNHFCGAILFKAKLGMLWKSRRRATSSSRYVSICSDI
jgi:hypothetical protein